MNEWLIVPHMCKFCLFFAFHRTWLTVSFFSLVWDSLRLAPINMHPENQSCNMGHDNGYFSFAKTLIEHTPKSHLKKASLKSPLTYDFSSPSKYQVKGKPRTVAMCILAKTEICPWLIAQYYFYCSFTGLTHLRSKVLQ